MISTKITLPYGSWSSSSFQFFGQIPGFPKTIEFCLNFCLGFCITWLALLNYKKTPVDKSQFYMNHASRLKRPWTAVRKFITFSLGIKHLQIKLQRVQKVWIWAFSRLIHQVNLNWILNWNKIFDKKNK